MKNVWTRVALVLGATIATTHTSMEAGTGVSIDGNPAEQAQAKAAGSTDAIRAFRAPRFPDEALADLKRPSRRHDGPSGRP